MEKKKETGFKLILIKTEQFAIFKENYTQADPISINTSLWFKLNNESRMIASFVEFTFEQGIKPIIKIQISCHFEIQNISWIQFIKSKTSSLIIPKDFLAHLAMQTVGTCRGILFAKTEGTKFTKFIIPPIDVTEIVNEDAKFEIKDGQTK